jgi:hypothetical protein
MDYVHELRREPKWLEIKVDDGRCYTFAKTTIIWRDPYLGLGCILSDGRFIPSFKEHFSWHHDPFSDDLREGLGELLVARDELTQSLFPAPIHSRILEPLTQGVIPKENFTVIYQGIAWREKVKAPPREILIDKAVSQIGATLHELLRGGDSLYLIVLTDELPSLTLRELVERSSDRGQRMGEIAQEEFWYWPRWFGRHPFDELLADYGHERERNGLLAKLLGAIRNFLHDFEGWEFTPFLYHPALSSTLRHAVYLGHCRPEEKASFLLEEIANALGFHRSAGGVWVKTDGIDKIEIYPNSSVSIDGRMVCIMPKKPIPLPRGDLIAAKMIFMATSLRETVETLMPFRNMLARLFPQGELALKGLNINHLREVLNG